MPRAVAITGGRQGIGRAIAELFLARGEQVAVCGRSSATNGLPQGILRMSADVRRREEVFGFAQSVKRQFGKLDLWINCAGFSRWRSIEEADEAFVSEMIETNLIGTLWGCAAAAQELSPGGCIVNVSSLAGKRGSANNSIYCAAKFAVNGLTQALAKELGAKGIRVNAVCPVYVETEGVLSALKESSSPAAGKPVGEYLAAFTATQTALGRLPKASEVAEAVYFLSSPAASAVTGQCLNVDCGTLPQ